MSNINTTSTDTGSSGSRVGSKLRGAGEVVHGIGDSIRGTALEIVECGQAKREVTDIAARGREEVERGMSRIEGRPLPGATGTGPHTVASGVGAGMGNDIGIGPRAGATGGYDSAHGRGPGQYAAQHDTKATGAGTGAAVLEHEKDADCGRRQPPVSEGAGAPSEGQQVGAGYGGAQQGARVPPLPPRNEPVGAGQPPSQQPPQPAGTFPKWEERTAARAPDRQQAGQSYKHPEEGQQAGQSDHAGQGNASSVPGARDVGGAAHPGDSQSQQPGLSTVPGTLETIVSQNDGGYSGGQ
ncbi:hypothetical protein FA95DRAFT_184552 [Auriscalpium vulgare]|uniref:Uncharacterized protein n=1 Tax=Auriscalpium vulgare TaxID=40419 RepID=A0ACB8RMS0_9AGAM|nr:hypothetical protein FA95DRAFT_184552 [Auriscalpium vulgare]